MHIPEKEDVRSHHGEALKIIHPDRLKKVLNSHILPFRHIGTIDDAAAFLLNPAHGEITRLQRRFVTGGGQSYQRHWFPERRRQGVLLDQYRVYVDGASATPITATRDGAPRPGSGAGPSTPGGFRDDPFIIEDDDTTLAPPRTPRTQSQFSVRTPRTPARSTPYPVPSPATERRLQAGTFAGNTVVFVGWSRPQLRHLASVPGRLDWASAQNRDQRAAVVACITNFGSVTFRMTLYNLRALGTREITGQAGEVIPDTYRLSNSDRAVIAYGNIVLAGHLRGMALGQVRSEVARLSLLPARQRFPQPWYATPPEWRN